MLHVRYSVDALKDLKTVGHIAAGRLIERIAAYAFNPAAASGEITRLGDTEHLRLRVGDYRVLHRRDGVVFRIVRGEISAPSDFDG